MTLAGGASASGCFDSNSAQFDLDQNLKAMTVYNGGDSRDYYVSAGVEGQN